MPHRFHQFLGLGPAGVGLGRELAQQVVHVLPRHPPAGAGAKERPLLACLAGAGALAALTHWAEAFKDNAEVARQFNVAADDLLPCALVWLADAEDRAAGVA
jgi:hypothetical protein